jgi:hypothetical protein
MQGVGQLTQEQEHALLSVRQILKTVDDHNLAHRKNPTYGSLLLHDFEETIHRYYGLSYEVLATFKFRFNPKKRYVETAPGQWVSFLKLLVSAKAK